ncbi:MAG: hypothetical protein ACR2GY_09040 [Phycisphaerales bacterium]
MHHVSAPSRTTRRGLTLVEMMLALTITVMIAGAIASMMAAAAQGVGAKRDTRSVMIRANAAQSRLSGYLLPARCILAHQPGELVIWYRDERPGDTVHTTEVRWLRFDPEEGAIDVLFITFPVNWTENERRVADKELPAATDWNNILASYTAQGVLGSVRIVDGLQSIDISLDDPNVLQADVVSFDLEFTTQNSTELIRQTTALRMHNPPVL